jgi:hypothetical protein
MLPVVDEWILVHVEYSIMTRFTLFHQKKIVHHLSQAVQNDQLYDDIEF